jgi:hypothetical protein
MKRNSPQKFSRCKPPIISDHAFNVLLVEGAVRVQAAQKIATKVQTFGF